MLKNKISIIKIIINIYIFNFILNNMKILFLKSILKVIENMDYNHWIQNKMDKAIMTKLYIQFMLVNTSKEIIFIYIILKNVGYVWEMFLG